MKSQLVDSSLTYHVVDFRHPLDVRTKADVTLHVHSRVNPEASDLWDRIHESSTKSNHHFRISTK